MRFSPGPAEILDLSRPVAVMLLAVLDYLPDLARAQRIVARLVAAVAPGSFLVISHAASDIDPAGMAEMIARLNEDLVQATYTRRPREVAGRA